jgi:alpha-tubulin suppressor-like RCC1 family protein
VLPRAYTSISAGGGHTCGLTPDSTAFCWGANEFGQLGAGDTVIRNTPVAVKGGLHFTSLSAGGFHTCALTAVGAAYCWGDGDSVPKPVGVGLTFALLAAGGTIHTCAITTVGTAYCWGYNSQGQLGDGDTTRSATPVAVAGGLSFASISTGGAHSCGLTAAGSAYCWGFNNSGQLGDSTTTDRWSPVPVKGGLTFAMVVAGGVHTCGLTTTSGVYCWGANGSYELGDGTNLGHTTPVAVQTTVAFAGLGSAVGSHTCGVTGSGLGYCWGSDFFGQIGDGTAGSVAPTPHAIAGALTFASLSGGSTHSCGLSTSHVAYCWGSNNDGQLGTGSFGGNYPTPVPITGQTP